jgi:hypothetical protein
VLHALHDDNCARPKLASKEPRREHPAGSRAIDHAQSVSAIFMDLLLIDVVITRVMDVRTAIIV